MSKGVLLMSILVWNVLHAQAQLKGRVLDETGNPVPHASVTTLRNKLSAVTDINGHFRLALAQVPDTLRFSVVGYKTYQVIVTDKNISDPNFEVVLLAEAPKWKEVIVTGYAMTGLGLEGTASGIRIRGTSSFSGKGMRTARKADASGTIASVNVGSYYKSPATSDTISVARTSILTAGEVNDFTKWTMWQDYSEKDFKLHSDHWGLYSNYRFAVQLVDTKHRAIVNEPVFLVHTASKDTVWKAITDNTGKAELWANFFDAPGQKNINSNDYFITDRYGKAVAAPTLFAKGVNQLELKRDCKVSNDIDIAFVVDATGSMTDEIEFLKLELEDVLQKSMNQFPQMKMRSAAVFYRDVRDAYLTKHTGFHDDLLKTSNFIKMQTAAGGGDYPEAVEAALRVAIDSLRWNAHARTRLLFLVLDAPPHDEAKKEMQALIAKAAREGIRIIPIGCSGINKTTEFIMRSIALATNGTYTFLTDHSGVGNVHIKPTTDHFDVELLNHLLTRLISQFVYADECDPATTTATAAIPGIPQSPRTEGVKIYPNPTQGRFTIESKIALKELYIADFTGKILQRLSDAAKKGVWNVDISGYASGTYLVRYLGEDGRWGAEKVILIH